MTWIDLGTFYRTRQNIIPLNNAVALTRGNPAGTVALFSHFSPAQRSFIGLLENEAGFPALIGQVEIPHGSPSARLTYYISQNEKESELLPYLLEGLIKQAGLMGATNVTAELNENHPAFESFRRSGFSVYARQRIWRMPSNFPKISQQVENWRDINEMDRIYMQSLVQNLVPPMVQRVEGLPHAETLGLVYLERGERYGLVDCQYGLKGIFLQPFIHPEVGDTRVVFQQLMNELPSIFDRPVYIAIRSYQAWLERDLEALGAEASEPTVLMVKHMGLQSRAALKEASWAALEKNNPQPSPTHYLTSARKKVD